jgi:hypothetical protein
MGTQKKRSTRSEDEYEKRRKQADEKKIMVI